MFQAFQDWRRPELGLATGAIAARFAREGQ